MTRRAHHVVLVEALDAFTDVLTCDPDERELARGLGLPIDAIAGQLDCDVTILAWDDWHSYAASSGSIADWIAYPATRPIHRAAGQPLPSPRDRVAYRRIAATDPTTRADLSNGVSAPSHGLLADSDPHFFASFCLNLELLRLQDERPISLLIMPMWGGIGYMPQMARATGLERAVHAPAAVVVTDTSARRQIANDEGFWTRAGVTRRQMEDLSLALADVALTFGPRGDDIARRGRPAGAPGPIRAPRFVPDRLLEAIERAAERPVAYRSVRFFIDEPQEGASGVLAALDAAQELASRGVALDHPVVATGPDMRFAPMQPRSFVDYWSSRAFARELVATARWQWESARAEHAADALPVRLYPSCFEHLPAVWCELARGSLVVMSPAAAEGVAPAGVVRPELMLPDPPAASAVAATLEVMAAAGPATLDRWRRDLCADVVSCFRSDASAHLLSACADALAACLTAPARIDLSSAASILLNRVAVPTANAAATVPVTERRNGGATLSVVVPCYNLGATIRETLESVWASARMPDEVLVVDDGSNDEATLRELDALDALARQRGVPFSRLTQSNKGLARARNEGLRRATGDYVSFLDADDLVEPAFYGLAAGILDDHAGVGGVACWAYLFGQDMPDMFWNAPQPELPLLLVENQVVVPCVMRTAVVRALGGYDAALRYNYEDWEMSVRLLAAGYPIVTIPAYLHRYRVRRDSLFRSMTVAQHLRMREVFFERHRETVGRFAVETSMLLEHERGRARYVAQPQASAEPRSLRWREWWRSRPTWRRS